VVRGGGRVAVGPRPRQRDRPPAAEQVDLDQAHGGPHHVPLLLLVLFAADHAPLVHRADELDDGHQLLAGLVVADLDVRLPHLRRRER
jgi:hypothetical protein